MPSVVGVPKEAKDQNRRVSVQSEGVTELVDNGHEVVVDAGAGQGSGRRRERHHG